MFALAAPAVFAEDTATLWGHVFDKAGRPWPGVEVIVEAVGAEMPVRRSTADAQGKFRFVNIPFGQYTLAVEREADGPVGGVLRRTLGPHYVHRIDGISVGRGGTRCDVHVPREATVTVSVAHHDSALAETAVRLTRLDGDGNIATVGEPINARATTDRLGRATLDVSEGIYGVTVEVATWDVGCGILEVTHDGSRDCLVSVGAHALRVRVVDGRGAPVAQAVIGVAGRDRWIGTRGRATVGMMSGEDGWFSVPGLREGPYDVYVNGFGAYAEQQGVVVPRDKEVVLKMPPTGTLVVTLVGANGKPIADAEIWLERPSGIPTLCVRTDAHGQITMDVTAETWLVGTKTAAVPTEGQGSGEAPKPSIEWRKPPREVVVEAFSRTVVRLRADGG